MRRLALFLTLFLGCASLSTAGLFSDDEAHQKITVLQKQIQGMEEHVAQMENTARTQGVGLLSQLDALKSELATLRGQVEVHAHDIETTQKRQRDLYVDLDSRLRKLENVGGAAADAPGQADSAKPASSDQTPAAVSPTNPRRMTLPWACSSRVIIKGPSTAFRALSVRIPTVSLPPVPTTGSATPTLICAITRMRSPISRNWSASIPTVPRCRMRC